MSFRDFAETSLRRINSRHLVLTLHWGETFLVHEMSASGTPAVPGQAGLVRFDIVDVIEFRDGLVWSKNSYLDASPLAAFMQVPAPAAVAH